MENSMSSVSRWNGHGPVSSSTARLKRNPVPETAQLVPRRERAWFKYRLSRRNHRA